MSVRAVFLLGLAVAMLAACGTTPPKRDEAGASDALPTIPRSSKPVAEAAFMALSLVGTPYAARGESPSEGFDCSGLVAYVYARALQLELPRNTFGLARTGVAVKQKDMQPGDLVFYDTQRRPYSHVGIYLGDARFVHAPSSGGAVRVENMRVDYWTKRFNGVRRVAR
jgi:cell wall-associated NlpC family hydrolase